MRSKLNSRNGNYPVRIAIEGLDGAGKTTQTELLAESLAIQGIKAVVFRYSALRNDIIGTVIRKLYNSTKTRAPILNQLSRVRLLQELLFSLQANLNFKDLGDVSSCRLILLDRCTVTAFIAHTDDTGNLLFSEKIISWLESKFVPDYVIYLSISSQLAQGRIVQRTDKSSDEYLEKMMLMERNYNRIINGIWKPLVLRKIRKWFIVEANETVDNIHKQLAKIISEILILEGTNDETMQLSAN